MKKILLAGILAVCVVFAARSAMAEEFALLKLGTLDTAGKNAKHWYFTGTRPELKGTASRGANVDITLDSSFNTVKASVTDGTWSFKPEKDLEKKDYNVTIASGDQQISFILSIGMEMPANTGGDAEAPTQLPQTGALIPTLLLLVTAGGFMYFGFREKIV